MNQNRWSEYKKRFCEDAVVEGLTDTSRVQEMYPMGLAVPVERLNTWLNRLRANPEVKIAPQERLVNHFKLGADPEFVFVTPKMVKVPHINELTGRTEYVMVPQGPQRVQADQFGMRQGQAFGADNNGRLVEVRPFPSRSALEVTASLLAAMRWMAITRPEVRGYEWQAGAYKFGDGLGGHIHFGRKRPGRDNEIAALDVVSDMSLALEMFPMTEVAQRRNGDQFRQIYGAPGDFRLQGHGYEYRTFPSWLDSPWATFFMLTIAKLTVLNPELVLRFKGHATVPASGSLVQRRIRNLLGYYRGVDDDARLAVSVLERRGFPKFRGGDFRERWGVNYPSTWEAPLAPKFIPPSIAPSEEDTNEMGVHLLEGNSLTSRAVTPTWTPTEAPKGYHMLIDQVSTTHVKGLGELIWEMVGSGQIKISVVGDREGEMHQEHLGVTRALMMLIGPHRLKEACQKVDKRLYPIETGNRETFCLKIPAQWREGGKGKQMKEFLLSGIFPIWSVFKVGAESVAKWSEVNAAAQKAPVKEQKFVGKVIS